MTGVGENEQGLPEEAPRAWRRWSRRTQNVIAILWSSFLAPKVLLANEGKNLLKMTSNRVNYHLENLEK